MDETAAGPADPGRMPSNEEVTALLDQLTLTPEADLIGLLQKVQEEFGYLPASALEEISRRRRIPLSRIYGVGSFYAHFYTEPRGRHTIRCCRGTACHVRGGKKIITAIEERLGIQDGETTDDMMFSFETVACLGTCFLAPAMSFSSCRSSFSRRSRWASTWATGTFSSRSNSGVERIAALCRGGLPVLSSSRTPASFWMTCS